MGRLPRIIDWERPYGVNIGASGKSLGQDGIDYNMQGVEIIDEEEREEEGQEGQVLTNEAAASGPVSPPPELFKVPSLSASVSEIREAYEKHIGSWDDIPGTGYNKRKGAIMALRNRLDELLLTEE